MHFVLANTAVWAKCHIKNVRCKGLTTIRMFLNLKFIYKVNPSIPKFMTVEFTRVYNYPAPTGNKVEDSTFYQVKQLYW